MLIVKNVTSLSRQIGRHDKEEGVEIDEGDSGIALDAFQVLPSCHSGGVEESLASLRVWIRGIGGEMSRIWICLDYARHDKRRQTGSCVLECGITLPLFPHSSNRKRRRTSKVRRSRRAYHAKFSRRCWSFGRRSARAEAQSAVPGIDPDGLALVEFPFENIEAERIENLFLDRAFERTRAVDGVVPFPRN
jgi:hypothetical protein